MSQSGDTPQPGLADAFFAAYGRWPVTARDSLDFAVFQAQCDADWRAEVAAGAGQYGEFAPEDIITEVAAPEPIVAELADGPTIPAGLDLTEVFAAVPPENLFDEDLREEFLYLPRGQLSPGRFHPGRMHR